MCVRVRVCVCLYSCVRVRVNLYLVLAGSEKGRRSRKFSDGCLKSVVCV